MEKNPQKKRSRGKRGSRRYRGKRRRREWTSSSSETSESSEEYAFLPEKKEEKPKLSEVNPRFGYAFSKTEDYQRKKLDYTFNVCRGPRDGKLYFVAKEVLKDGLGMKGFRGSMKDIPRSEKFRRKVGPGNKKLCISEDGLATILSKTRSDHRIAMIVYLNKNYGLSIPTRRGHNPSIPKGRIPMATPDPKGKEEGRSTDPVAEDVTPGHARISWEGLENLVLDLRDDIINMERKLGRIDARLTADSMAASFARAKESQHEGSSLGKGKDLEAEEEIVV
jgi:hypothetical protein